MHSKMVTRIQGLKGELQLSQYKRTADGNRANSRNLTRMAEAMYFENSPRQSPTDVLTMSLIGLLLRDCSQHSVHAIYIIVLMSSRFLYAMYHYEGFLRLATNGSFGMSERQALVSRQGVHMYIWASELGYMYTK